MEPDKSKFIVRGENYKTCHQYRKSEIECSVFIPRNTLSLLNKFSKSIYVNNESESHSVVSDSLRPHGLYSP